jgi:hypothetical protein
MMGDMDDTARAVEESRVRSIEHVERAIATVRQVIEQNRRLARDFPDHRDSAEDRVIDGERELAVLEAQLQSLSSGGGL